MDISSLHPSQVATPAQNPTTGAANSAAQADTWGSAASGLAEDGPADGQSTLQALQRPERASSQTTSLCLPSADITFDDLQDLRTSHTLALPNNAITWAMLHVAIMRAFYQIGSNTNDAQAQQKAYDAVVNYDVLTLRSQLPAGDPAETALRSAWLRVLGEIVQRAEAPLAAPTVASDEPFFATLAPATQALTLLLNDLHSAEPADRGYFANIFVPLARNHPAIEARVVQGIVLRLQNDKAKQPDARAEAVDALLHIAPTHVLGLFTHHVLGSTAPAWKRVDADTFVLAHVVRPWGQWTLHEIRTWARMFPQFGGLITDLENEGRVTAEQQTTFVQDLINLYTHVVARQAARLPQLEALLQTNSDSVIQNEVSLRVTAPNFANLAKLLPEIVLPQLQAFDAGFAKVDDTPFSYATKIGGAQRKGIHAHLSSFRQLGAQLSNDTFQVEVTDADALQALLHQGEEQRARLTNLTADVFAAIAWQSQGMLTYNAEVPRELQDAVTQRLKERGLNAFAHGKYVNATGIVS